MSRLVSLRKVRTGCRYAVSWPWLVSYSTFMNGVLHSFQRRMVRYENGMSCEVIIMVLWMLSFSMSSAATRFRSSKSLSSEVSIACKSSLMDSSTFGCVSLM